MYVPFHLPISTLLVRSHQCDTAYFRDLTCIGGGMCVAGLIRIILICYDRFAA